MLPVFINGSRIQSNKISDIIFIEIYKYVHQLFTEMYIVYMYVNYSTTDVQH